MALRLFPMQRREVEASNRGYCPRLGLAVGGEGGQWAGGGGGRGGGGGWGGGGGGRVSVGLCVGLGRGDGWKGTYNCSPAYMVSLLRQLAHFSSSMLLFG